MMRRRKIGILALQETHYTEDYVASITERYGDALHVEYSAMPGRQAARAGGVALIFYKPIANVIGIETKIIIPGRAMVVKVPWHGDDVLNVHVGYAPNDHNENKEHWETLEEYYRENPQWKPDIACFDTNIVADGLDRLPAHEDHQGAVKALTSFLNACSLVDGWRKENPNVAAFTYTQLTTPASHSRIDRIYVKKTRWRQCRNWDMAYTAFDGVPTDHKRVSCEITTAAVPEQGHGRYTLPIFSVKSKKMTKMINETGISLHKEMNEITPETRTEEYNAQILYDAWKTRVNEAIRSHAKQNIPKAKKEIEDLEEQL
ncbi:DNase I-like protein, partial [Hymenopellis radicata]